MPKSACAQNTTRHQLLQQISGVAYLGTADKNRPCLPSSASHSMQWATAAHCFPSQAVKRDTSPQAQTAANRIPVEDRGVERLRVLRWMSTGLDEVVKTRFEW